MADKEKRSGTPKNRILMLTTIKGERVLFVSQRTTRRTEDYDENGKLTTMNRVYGEPEGATEEQIAKMKVDDILGPDEITYTKPENKYKN